MTRRGGGVLPFLLASGMPKFSPFKFMQEVRAEASKVTWPTWKETWLTSVMVFIMIVLFMIFFFFVDQALGYALRLLLGV